MCIRYTRFKFLIPFLSLRRNNVWRRKRSYHIPTNILDRDRDKMAKTRNSTKEMVVVSQDPIKEPRKASRAKTPTKATAKASTKSNKKGKVHKRKAKKHVKHKIVTRDKRKPDKEKRK